MRFPHTTNSHVLSLKTVSIRQIDQTSDSRDPELAWQLFACKHASIYPKMMILF